MKKLLPILAALVLPTFSIAGNLNDKPMLRLNNPMHSDWISNAAINQDETKLLTVSQDATAKLWDIQTGELLHTYRLPLLTSDFKGELFDAAFDAEDRWIAVSGATGNLKSTYVYIIHPENGSILKQLTIPSSFIVLTLCTSPDGNKLAAGGFMGTIAWTTENWHEIGSDLTDGLHPTMDCLFTPKNELITLNEDKSLRLYDKDMSLKDMADLEEDFPELEQGLPYRITLQKDGQNFAIGMNSQPSEVYLGTVEPMAVTAKLDTENMDNALNIVEWSVDENTLYVAGNYQKVGMHPVIGLDKEGQNSATILSGHLSRPTNIFALKNNTLLSVGLDRSWMLQTTDGDVLVARKPENIDGEAIACNALQVSPDGRKVYIDSDSSLNTPILIDLEQKRVTSALNVPKDMRSAKTDGLPITNWQGRYPKFDDKELSGLGRARETHCLAIAGDNQSFALSTKDYLRQFNRDGFLSWAKRSESGLHAVNITEDQRLIVALSKDGIIHWYRYADGEEVLSMFINQRTLEWVIWTPDGYFDASENGADMIGWQINQGYSTPKFYTAKSLHDDFYTPDIANKVFKGTYHVSDSKMTISDYLMKDE